MSLETRLTELTQAIGQDIGALYANQGNLAALTTTAKTSLVAAINELAGLGSPDAEIDDAAPNTSTTRTYSASRITALLLALRDEILGGASSAYDTLLEIQQALENDDTAISGLVSAVANRVRFDAAQTLTDPQQLTARTNIGAQSAAAIGDTDHDFVADYEAAKA